MRVIRLLVVSAIFLLPSAGYSFAFSTGAASNILSTKVLFHGILHGMTSIVRDGSHTFHIRIFGLDSALIHDETLEADIRGGSYDLLLGSSSPLMANLQNDCDIHVTIDSGIETEIHSKLSTYILIQDNALGSTFEDEAARVYIPLDNEQISAQLAENIARARGLLISPLYARSSSAFLPYVSPISGLTLEISIAPPSANMPLDPYEIGKYGRVGIEYNHAFLFDGSELGMAAQALHVAHHLLLYSAGLTSDINNDGMFLLTGGLAHYQTGNSRAEPFVDAPFMRLKFQTSQDDIFGYSELESTMNYRSYISGTIGFGMRITRGVRIIGGFQHTEFVMPTEQLVRQVNGIEGIIRWGL
jgi:hypothetical protein